MKYILKSKDLLSTEDKPYYLRFNENVRNNFPDLVKLDSCAFDDIPLTSFQKDLLSSRGRTFFIVTYYPIEIVRFILDNLDSLSHWAFCLHDRDYDENGEIKKPHIHLLLYFSDLVTASELCSWFHTTQFKIISRTDVTNEWNYLIHDSKACRKARKYLYDKSERITDSEDYWLSRCTGASENDKFVSMVDDMVSVQCCKLKYRDFVKKYGAFAIMQYENIRKAATLFMRDNDYFDVVPAETDDNINEVF